MRLYAILDHTELNDPLEVSFDPCGFKGGLHNEDDISPESDRHRAISLDQQESKGSPLWKNVASRKAISLIVVTPKYVDDAVIIYPVNVNVIANLNFIFF